MIIQTQIKTVANMVANSLPHLEAIDAFLHGLEQARDDDHLRDMFSQFSANYDLNVPQDPFSQAYRDQQFALYKHLTGRDYAITHEKSEFDVAHHAIHPFPFCHGSAATVGNQLLAIGFLIKVMNLPKGAKILEFGPGWGNTTLLLAKMGYQVNAIDIEPNFVELIKTRARMEQIELTCLQGDFSSITHLQDKFDAILFFECFHHAQDHLALMRDCHHVLKEEGLICFGAEPISADFPLPWGLRMDGESLWAIRKNGWLELGFNIDYFHAALRQTGWIGQEHRGHDGLWSHAIIAKRASQFAKTFGFIEHAQQPYLRHQIGELEGETLIIRPHEEGYAIYGPYQPLPAGQWDVEILSDETAPLHGQFTLDCVDDMGTKILAPEIHKIIQQGERARLAFSFTSTTELQSFEVRLKIAPHSQARLKGLRVSPRM